MLLDLHHLRNTTSAWHRLPRLKLHFCQAKRKTFNYLRYRLGKHPRQSIINHNLGGGGSHNSSWVKISGSLYNNTKTNQDWGLDLGMHRFPGLALLVYYLEEENFCVVCRRDHTSSGSISPVAWIRFPLIQCGHVDFCHWVTRHANHVQLWN